MANDKFKKMKSIGKVRQNGHDDGLNYGIKGGSRKKGGHRPPPKRG